jgi:predicted RNA-binding Zn-ribbon protein involved in translation (DUF1610 family)
MLEKDLRTKSNEYNAATAITMGYQEIRNSAENWCTIMEHFRTGRAHDLNEEPKKLNVPVILTGSGPSLDDTIEKLKEWKGAIICHYSQALTLMYHGIEPDYIVALDAICNWEGLEGVDWSKTKTKLVLHPGMWPSLVANWPNEFLFYRQNLGKPDSFGVNEQKIMYCERQGTLQDALDSRISFKPLINTELTMFACTPPAQLFVAQVLQYGAVFLTGMDFAYHGTKERFTNYEMTAGQWIRQERHLQDLQREYVQTNNGLKTDPLHLYYKKNFISACRLSMQRVFSTDKGAILNSEIPYVDIDKVIATQGRSTKWDIPPNVRMSQYEKYLATLNCFVINFEKGAAFVEVQEPLRDLAGFMATRNREYTCTSCGAGIQAPNDNDHTGTACANCGKTTTQRINNCDVEANMKRFKSLIEYVKEIS